MAISQSTDTALIDVKENSNTTPELVECLEDIQSQTQRAGEIIRALRQFMRKDTVNRSALNLNTLINQTIQLLSPEARKYNVILKSKPNDVPEPVADRVQIAQVLVNLLRNSVDAIAESECHERQVTVETHSNEKEISVIVDDTGPGLADGVVPFKAIETSKVDGMGMGLSISRSIIESHGGKLWFDEMKGNGARFLFTLPVGAKS